MAAWLPFCHLAVSFLLQEQAIGVDPSLDRE
jgi:hypothetical protein